MTTDRSRRVALAVLCTGMPSATRTERPAAEGQPGAVALTGGYQLTFLIGAGLVAVSFAIALAALKPGRPETEDEQHDELVHAAGL
ncbi:hypothetical protein [Nonomuraea sp. SYSU D8015]|uniref:hypothetical protein n=1 Tax=Nonomuraea sp. SYSU D8015 TaxID=2593644 RepID=UPI0016611683|nr:hypothetical protein [Nonomuraea sp. SYSU D8015]